MEQNGTTMYQAAIPNNLRRRLLATFFAIIGILFGLNIITLAWTGKYYRDLSGKIDTQVIAHGASSALDRIEANLGNYVSSSNREYLTLIAEDSDLLHQVFQRLAVQSEYRSQMYYQAIDAETMTTSLDEEIAKLVTEKSSGRPKIYILDHKAEIQRLISYIDSTLGEFNALHMQGFKDFYALFSKRILFSLQILALAAACLLISTSLAARRFVLSVSKPIHTLAMILLEFGNGNLDANMPVVNTHDETAILANSFNEMAQRIRMLVKSLKEKANLEKRLKQQEVRHHEMHRLLRESELALLQSQINPHFLFNTLNIIATLSQIEQAPKTETVITNLSKLLRHTLISQREKVTVAEELAIVRSYMVIQQARFGDRIIFEESIDPNTLACTIPAMVIQPLVENAIKHGLEPVSRKGTIRISSGFTTGARLCISIHDDGKGLSPEALSALAEGTWPQGIGLENVGRRLELCYGSRILDIHPAQPSGTECILVFPPAGENSSRPQIKPEHLE